MLAATVVFIYLALVLYVGIFAFRRSSGKEDFFLANRSLGTFVFLLSLFGSNMTSFAILGSSGLAFRQGIGVYGLMASISGIVIPLSIFIIGTRIWSLGKRFGHVTQVQIFRDRWEMGHIGTAIFVLQALMLVPYIIIGVMGGGETLEGVSDGAVPYWFGGAVVALVVMSYVFFGGMRGTAWVNTVQTLMFLVFGTITFFVIAKGMGGLGKTVEGMLATLQQPPAAASAPRPDGELLTRARIPQGYFLSYMFIPLSSIMFPHIAIFCLTAKRLASFRKTVIFYPLCIMAIWLPAVFLGAIATTQKPVVAHMAAGSEELLTWLRHRGGPDAAGQPTAPKVAGILARSKDPAAAALLADVTAGRLTEPDLSVRLSPINEPALRGELRRLANTNSDGAMLALLHKYAALWLAGILGAAIMACVMASDSQILALSTMWAEDVYAYYGGKHRFGETAQVWSARAFVVVITIIAYIIALLVHQYANIFELAIQYAFSGYASMAPIMLACLFWKRSTKWGALASTLWVAACLIGSSILQYQTMDLAPKPGTGAVAIPGWPLLYREVNRISFTEHRYLLVLPMFIGSALAMVIGSLLTRPPSRATLSKYFDRSAALPAAMPSAAGAA
jgi:Na+/proline symporter